MKFIIALLLSVSILSPGIAQVHDPVKWSARYNPLSETEGELLITATIEKGWHTYSQRPTTDGPIPTSFTFTPSKKYELKGNTVESDAHEEFVKAFEAKIFVFKDKAEFRQKIKLKDGAGFDVPLKLEYMSCNDLMCLPPKTIDLSVKVTAE
jgi:hypothetical protein